MTQAELVVLMNLPGPDSTGITDAVATDRCWRDGLNASQSWPIRKRFLEEGLVETEERRDQHGAQRLYYRLTEKGVAEKGKVAA